MLSNLEKIPLTGIFLIQLFQIGQHVVLLHNYTNKKHVILSGLLCSC